MYIILFNVHFYFLIVFVFNFLVYVAGNIGAGEREARIASDFVARRHFR